MMEIAEIERKCEKKPGSESERQIAESSNHKWNRKGSPVRDRYIGERTADGDFFPDGSGGARSQRAKIGGSAGASWSLE